MKSNEARIRGIALAGMACVLGFASSAIAGFQYVDPSAGPGIPIFGAEAADYIVDDGVVDNSVGLNDPMPTDFIWLNRFSVIPAPKSSIRSASYLARPRH